MNVRDSQLEEYIRTASIQMTEDEMRQAEQHYKIIEESEQNAAGEEEEKKESVPDSSANEEDEPTQLAKRISVGNKRTTSIIESL